MISEPQLQEYESDCDGLASRINRIPGVNIDRLWKSIRSEFCVAPSSSTGHGSFRGGLMRHTLMTVRICADIQPSGVEQELLLMAAFLHDIGKCGDGNNRYYTKRKKAVGCASGPSVYATLRLSPGVSHITLGLFHVQRFGVRLTHDQYMAILAHTEAVQSVGSCSMVKKLSYANKLATMTGCLCGI